MEETINLFNDYAKKMKNIALNYKAEPGIYVKTTVKGIEQVLNNLLGNAVKYTPENNTIHIDIKKTGNGAEISVQNNGVVIPAEQLSHLFEPFYQLSHEKQNAQGIGMGLYIVKRILDSTGGKIEVVSNEDIGVVFTVTIPTGTKDEITLQAATGTGVPILNAIMPKAKDTPYSVDKPCLLVVEDNNELLNYLVNELQAEYNVFVADNGLTALERLEHIPCPGLIISDIMMDKLNGNELLEKTLADERFAHIPFIFLTAKSTIADKISGLDSGALDFITKPFSINELKTKVKAIIAQKIRLSDAIVRDVKKQFTDTHHAAIKQKNAEMFMLNAVKYHLTTREIDIISYLCEGLTYEEIASKLHISENTVSRHIQNIYRKTGCSSRPALINKMYS